MPITSKQLSATFASIISAQRLAKVLDIMQKTVLNVAQKMAWGSIFLQICFMKEKKAANIFLFFVKTQRQDDCLCGQMTNVSSDL